MKLHWSPRSPYVRKVMIAAHELGLAERLELVRTPVAMRTPNAELMRDNPLSKIPTLVLDSGQALFDSRTICEYLDVLGGGQLFPPAGEARWNALTWQALGDGLTDILILWRNERDKPEPRRTPELLDAFALKAGAALNHVSDLAPRLAAARFGIGHAAIAAALGYLDFRFADVAWREQRAPLAAWFAEVKARPSMTATEAVDA